MQFIETARRLELHAFSVCTKAPKRYALLLTNRIFELASTVHEEVRAANNWWERSPNSGNTNNFCNVNNNGNANNNNASNSNGVSFGLCNFA